MIFNDGDRIRLVAWQTQGRHLLGLEHPAADDLASSDMIDIARTAKPLS